jgi:hypothetical protein
MIFILLSFFSVPLEGSADLFLGYYLPGDTIFNVDVSIRARVNLIRIKNEFDFFTQYSSYLEMIKLDEAKVIFHPSFTTHSIILGLQYTKTFCFSFFLDHWCRHLIDKEFVGRRIVFNALNFEFSNKKDPAYRFSEDYYFSGNYIFYPQGIVVDWLNSKPYYRHRFIFFAGKRINSLTRVAIELEYTLSNDNPKQTYYIICPEIDFFKQKESGTFYSFFKYYLKAKSPLRSPEQKLLFGLGYSFYSPCKQK